MTTSRMHGSADGDSAADELPWGYASGWAQLYGQRRNVSCVVLGLGDCTGLATIFDSLSDELTEAGYPWEVLMVDAGANPVLSSWLRAWCERPGFRRVVLPLGAAPSLALTVGLEKARGDAVLLMEARDGELAISIPDMVSRWSDGLEVVRSRWVDSGGAGHAGSQRPSAGQQTTRSPGTHPSGASGFGRLLGDEVVLLDRHAVSALLEGR